MIRKHKETFYSEFVRMFVQWLNPISRRLPVVYRRHLLLNSFGVSSGERVEYSAEPLHPTRQFVKISSNVGSYITMVMSVGLILLKIKVRILKILLSFCPFWRYAHWFCLFEIAAAFWYCRHWRGLWGCGTLFPAKWDTPTLPSWCESLKLIRSSKFK